MRRCTAVCAAASLERFVLEAASGEYGIDGADAILCEKMELDVASGSVSVSQMSVIDLELSLASGNVAYEGAPSPRRCASIRRQASFALGSARLLQKPLRAPSLRVISSWSFPPTRH